MANGISIPEGREAAVRLRYSGDVGQRAGVDGGELVVDNEDVADAKMHHGHVVIRAKKAGQTAVRYKLDHPEDDSGEKDMEAILMVSVTGEDDDAGNWPTGVEFDTSDVQYDEPKHHRGKTERQKRREAKMEDKDRKEDERDANQGSSLGEIDPNRRQRTGLGEDEDKDTERAAGAANLEGQRPIDPKGELEESIVATQGAGAPRGGAGMPGSGEPVPSAERIRNPNSPATEQPGPRVAPRAADGRPADTKSPTSDNKVDTKSADVGKK